MWTNHTIIQDELISVLHLAEKLEVLHINFPLEAGDGPPVVSPANALRIARHCSSTLTQLGCNTRVWQVREIIRFLSPC